MLAVLPCPDQPCLSFNEYAREKDRYILDGTTFVFLSGVHQLDLRLRLENVSNISLGPLEGDGSVQILLNPMVNISGLDSNNVTITGLDIFLSGLPNDESLFSSLALQNITNCLLSRLNFFGNDSWQSKAIRTHSSVVNLSDVMVSGVGSLYGAALIAFNSTIDFIGHNSFVNNRASQGGGAVYIIQSVVSFRGNVSFISNIVFSTSNLALGGAIHCQTSILSFSGSALFMRNFAASLNLQCICTRWRYFCMAKQYYNTNI